MSLHDRLANMAISMGKSSSQFKAAAQKHANTTWLLLIGGGVVWYFLGWAWALIPIAFGVYTAFKSVSSTMVATRLKNCEEASESAGTDFVHIVQTYGRFLEKSAPIPGMVADASKLPYPKQQIKDAIVAALRSTDDQQIKEHLKIGYIQLSDWQEGVGETDQGLDLSALDMNQDAESLAKAISEQSSVSESWTEMVQKEQRMLKQQLQTLGFW